MYRRLHDLTTDELLAKAQRHCARQEQCVSGIRRKVAEWGGTPQQADAIVTQLVDMRFIDERRYVTLFCRDKLSINHWGRNKMLWELLAKGIDRTVIEQGLDALSDVDYAAALDKVARSKQAALATYDPDEQVYRLKAYLLGRGFTHAEIGQWLSHRNDDA